MYLPSEELAVLGDGRTRRTLKIAFVLLVEVSREPVVALLGDLEKDLVSTNSFLHELEPASPFQRLDPVA